MQDKASQRKNFNEKSQKLLKDAIERLPGLAESLKIHDINLAEEETINVFGYGSLPDQPHHPPTSKETAYLWDYRRDMCCRSVASGTYRAPGLTLGIDKKEGAIVLGSILSYEGMSLYEKIEMLNKLADREVIKKLPIYKFEILKVEKENGDNELAIICIADTSSKSGYVGDMITPMEKEHLNKEEQEDYSLHKKAAKIAAANGQKRINSENDDGEEEPKKFTTGKSYFDRFVLENIKENLIKTDPDKNGKTTTKHKDRQIALYKEQQRMIKLGEYINEYREYMKEKVPKLIAHFEQTEENLMNDWQENRAYLAEHLKQEANIKKKTKTTSKPPAKNPPAKHFKK